MSISTGELAVALRSHANRVGGGGSSDRNYDPETLALEHEAATAIEHFHARAKKAELILAVVKAYPFLPKALADRIEDMEREP